MQKTGHPDYVIINEDADGRLLVSRDSKKLYNALYTAAQNNDVDKIDEMATYFVDFNDVKDPENTNFNPISLAVVYKNKEVLRKLIEKQANPLIFSKVKLESNPFCMAARLGRTEMLDVLLETHKPGKQIVAEMLKTAIIRRQKDFLAHMIEQKLHEQFDMEDPELEMHFRYLTDPMCEARNFPGSAEFIKQIYKKQPVTLPFPDQAANAQFVNSEPEVRTMKAIETTAQNTKPLRRRPKP